jgi:hypothetical protein
MRFRRPVPLTAAVCVTALPALRQRAPNDFAGVCR